MPINRRVEGRKMVKSDAEAIKLLRAWRAVKSDRSYTIKAPVSMLRRSGSSGLWMVELHCGVRGTVRRGGSILWTVVTSLPTDDDFTEGWVNDGVAWSKTLADAEIARLEGLVAGLKGALERQERDIAALDRLKAWEDGDRLYFEIKGGWRGDEWTVWLYVNGNNTAEGTGDTLADATAAAFAKLEAATPKVCECCGQVVKPEGAE